MKAWHRYRYMPINQCRIQGFNSKLTIYSGMNYFWPNLIHWKVIMRAILKWFPIFGRQVTMIAMALLAMVVGTGTASAKVIYATASATEIAMSFSNDNAIIDVDGNGTGDMPGVYYNRTRDTIGVVDVKGVARVNHVETLMFQTHNPLTGALIARTKANSHVLRYDVDAASPWNVYMNWGMGIFTVGANRFITDVMGVESWLPVAFPLLRGTKYIDAAFSVIIFNAKTGVAVKRFSITSSSVWQLIPSECRFADINGVTYFIEKYEARPKAAPGPGRIVSRILTKIYNYNHTVLVKQFVKTHIAQ